MGTRAKFYVSALTSYPGLSAGVKVSMAAVSRGDTNASWATATPIGQLEMTVNNPAAVTWWENFMQAARATGRPPEVFLDITPSTDGWPGDGHPFRESVHAAGISGHGMCGECGQPREGELKVWDVAEGAYVGTGTALH